MEPRSTARMFQFRPAARQRAFSDISDVELLTGDPAHWRSLAARAMRGDKNACRELLIEFGACLDVYFVGTMNETTMHDVVEETLQSVAAKLNTCDIQRPIMPWLIAIARYRAAHPMKAKRMKTQSIKARSIKEHRMH